MSQFDNNSNPKSASSSDIYSYSTLDAMESLNLANFSSQKYYLLDSGNFKKYECFGPYKIVRPSPAAVWSPFFKESAWECDAEFIRFNDGKGEWRIHNKKLPESWTLSFELFQMKIQLTPFGHMGVFVEQEENWKSIFKICKKKINSPMKVLNLFAYTGGASLACAIAGAEVVHVDASKTSVSWARENAELNNISNIKWIVDDVIDFVRREARRGNKYQGLILDPPSYGRGPKNQLWKIEEQLPELLAEIKKIAAEDLQFILLSSHSSGYSPISLQNLIIQDFSNYHLKYLNSEMLISMATIKDIHLPSGASCLAMGATAIST